MSTTYAPVMSDERWKEIQDAVVRWYARGLKRGELRELLGDDVAPETRKRYRGSLGCGRIEELAGLAGITNRSGGPLTRGQVKHMVDRRGVDVQPSHLPIEICRAVLAALKDGAEIKAVAEWLTAEGLPTRAGLTRWSADAVAREIPRMKRTVELDSLAVPV